MGLMTRDEPKAKKTVARDDDTDVGERGKEAPPPVPSKAGADKSLHTKFRPTTFKEVIGQDATVSSLSKILKKGGTRAFLFTGPSGTGKTTLGRIIAAKVGCSRQNLVEIDAATNSGIDAMRAVTDSMQYSALGGSPTKVYILDEAHALSKAAWQSLLKAIEEPPPHVYWVICTTESAKIPATISNRCAVYALKPVPRNDLMDLLERVKEAEGFDTPTDVIQLIASKANGSPRFALTALAKCARVEDRAEAAELMDVMGDENEGEAIELCRALIKGCEWEQAVEIVNKLKDQNPESVRCVVAAYFQNAILGTKDGRRAGKLLDILAAFSKPYATTQGIYPVLLSIGDALL
jgi:DNA polymerase III gamma/tau subunit